MLCPIKFLLYITMFLFGDRVPAVRDENSYYCFADIERRREQLKACSDELEMLDFGSGGSKEDLCPAQGRAGGQLRAHRHHPA